ncbi:MAG TPA: hypothetical protein VGW80_03100 [Solirubrobacterales bacterium]|jgi:predicted house-cleaning noncanonical NTP pyrophosphatase (MazG superfamily)|nr:hypothetical protein [Solirubrobacterales bacterium]
MEAGNWIALGAVGVAGLSNVITLRIAEKRLELDREHADQRFDHERRIEDRRIAGEILDEAVLEIRRIDNGLQKIKLLLRNRPEQFFSKEGGKKSYDALAKAGAELDQRADRLRFRFEGDLLVDTFEGVMQSSDSIFRALRAIREEDFEAADQEKVRQEIREFCEGKREEIIDLYEVFQAHFNDFRKAAFAVVGIRST